MLVRKCDRCGVYYDEADNIRVNDKDVNSITLRDRYAAGYDLCPDYLRELVGWLSVKEEDHGND